MRILICGDRKWENQWSISIYLQKLPKNQDTIIIHGKAKGADSLAGLIASTLDMKVIEYPANWKRYGRAAGMIRNQQMLDEGKPKLVVYFHNDLDNSKGTKDMVNRAIKAGIPVVNGTCPP